MQKNARLHRPPGSLNYTGAFTEEPTAIDWIRYHEGRAYRQSVTSIDAIDFEAPGIHWINVTGLSDVEPVEKLGKIFSVDKLLLEDIVHVSGRPKLESREDFLFAVLKMVYRDPSEPRAILKEHLTLLLKDHWVLTFQETGGDVFDPLRKRLLNGKGEFLKRGGDYLFYALFDAVVDHFFEVQTHLDGFIDEIEEAVIEEEEHMSSEIYTLRKELLLIRTALSPLKGMLLLLTQRDIPQLTDDVQGYFRDVQDHLAQVQDQLTLQREVVTNLLEVHQSNVNNNMNQVMTTLTVF